MSSIHLSAHCLTNSQSKNREAHPLSDDKKENSLRWQWCLKVSSQRSQAPWSKSTRRNTSKSLPTAPTSPTTTSNPTACPKRSTYPTASSSSTRWKTSRFHSRKVRKTSPSCTSHACLSLWRVSRWRRRCGCCVWTFYRSTVLSA